MLPPWEKEMESRINAFELKTGQPQKSILLEADRCRLYGLDFGYLFHGFFREGAADRKSVV